MQEDIRRDAHPGEDAPHRAVRRERVCVFVCAREGEKERVHAPPVPLGALRIVLVNGQHQVFQISLKDWFGLTS